MTANKSTIKTSLLRDFSRLLEKLDEWALICDADGKILLSSSEVQEITGFSIEEVETVKYFPHFTDSKNSNFNTYFLPSDEHDLSKRHTIEINKKGGDSKKVGVKYEPINYDGKEAYLVLISNFSKSGSYEAAIRKMELRQEALLDNIPYQAWLKDRNGVFIVANDEFAQAMGVAKGDLKGKNETDLIDKERREKYLAQDQQVMKDGYGKFEECIVKDGVEHWYETIKTAIKDDDGEVIGTSGITREITKSRNDRLSIEEDLKRHSLLTDIAYTLSKPVDFNERINKVLKITGEYLNVSRVYIFENDSDKQVTRNTYEWCNEGIAPQIDNLDPLPMSVAPSWFKILEEERMVMASDIFELPEDVIAILEPQEIKSIVVYSIYVNDEVFGFIGFDECAKNREWSYSEVELLKTVSHMISNSFQEHKYWSALKSSEQKYRELVEMLPEMVIETDEKGSLSFANNYSCDRFNVENLKIDEGSIHFYDLFTIEDKPSIVEHIGKILNNQAVHTRDFEYTAISRLGEKFPVLLFVNNIIENGIFKGLRAVMVDISERKMAEKRLEEAKKNAEDASKAKEQFLATMSHEIRTPLNAIIGMVNLMKDGEMKGNEEEAVDTLELSSRHLLNLINDILDFSKIEAGKVSMQESEFNLELLLENTIRMFRQKAVEKQLDLSLEMESSVPTKVIGDSGRLMQVLNNLISNALKFTEFGSVKISAKLVGSDTHQPSVEFQVADTGIGIPEHKYDLIFDSFSQVESSRTRKFEGTGLGLAITKKLVQLMEGEIRLDSEENKGSVFSFILPFKLSANIDLTHETAGNEEFEFDDLEGFKILVVEDNIINQKIAAKFLRRWQANVELAANGEEALNEVKRGDFDLVLMDIQMPVMDGYEATRKIRQLDSAKSEIPIIALTASALMEAQREVFDSGMNDFVTKPFNPEELFNKIKRMVRVNQ